MKKDNSFGLGLALLRICASALMMTHGFGKLQMLLNGGEIEFADPVGVGAKTSLILAVIGEFIAPIFVIIGFKTRWAALPTIITMMVAAFVIHGSDPLAKKEMALLYLVIFTTIALTGPGKFSIDGALGKKSPYA
ncbi:DoxX family protein [Sinomicrobium pectinilyticum]|uniref:DoxX family protein n=1 Tax=Sinomicrobium pectinilyticum TaxID=1084421 RepID=A0A3N0DYI7_SINP1|nr:DoxX family protein [Sinomicrobium pectinilyticum]RNL80679.1 DoxX family protein [Sinomicrobium pectinilyticum]